MLSRPRNGWCILSVSGWQDMASYIEDVPVKLLDGVERVMLDGTVVHIDLDGEDREYLLRLSPEQISVTTCYPGEEVVTRTFNLNIEDIARELIRDVRVCLEDWVDWPPGSERPGFDRAARRNMLAAYCDVIERLLPLQN